MSAAPEAPPTIADTETARRALAVEINAEPGSRAELEATYGEVWTTAEVASEFELLQFAAPLVVARRLSDMRLGSLFFQHSPRLYFGFQPHED